MKRGEVLTFSFVSLKFFSEAKTFGFTPGDSDYFKVLTFLKTIRAASKLNIMAYADLAEQLLCRV